MMKKYLYLTISILLISVALIGCLRNSDEVDKTLSETSKEDVTDKGLDETSKEDGTDETPTETSKEESETTEESKDSEEPEATKEAETTEQVTKESETTQNVTEKPDKYVVYIGEQLIIPVSNGTSTKESIVTKSALIPSGEKQIALTFDAGWLYDQTTDLLDVLDSYQVKSTFFLRGKWVEDHPDLAKDILKRGHSPENHSLTHGHMTEMSDQDVRAEIASTTQAIEKITGYRPYLFRPPYGEYDARILKILGQEGYPYTIMWTIDSLDWLEEYNGAKVTAEYLTDRILKNATDKGIVLMHIGGYETVNALPSIIEGLRNAGYKLVKVNDIVPKAQGSSDTSIHTVKKGETLYSISRQYGVSPEDILKANPNRKND